MAVERFTQILNSFLRDRTLSPEAKLIGAVFGSFANAECVAWPGTKRLMDETGLGRHVVERARSELVKGAYLKKVYSRGSEGYFNGVRYFVTERVLHRPPTRPAGTSRLKREVAEPFPLASGIPLDGDTGSRGPKETQ